MANETAVNPEHHDLVISRLVRAPRAALCTVEHPAEEPAEEQIQPSRTRRKLDDQALQDLGQALVAVGEGKLAELDLPERLRDAITQARGISRFGALRRQMQYIGRLMWR